jgi:hypothetical protein
MSKTRKPRLTAKVMEGLKTMAGQIESGDYLTDGGELEDSADEVQAAMRWIWNMARARSARTEGGSDGE